ncbi:MAG: N-methyl-L-tryptophan oxidase, partial [Planctomycetota bacterium]
MQYDVIVLGLGGVGSSAAYHLAKAGRRVLGLEQFSCAHSKGSSHGETRAIRKAYFEHPSYVPLLHSSYAAWRELEELSGSQLLFEQGLLEIGPPQGVLIKGLREACQQHQLELQDVSRNEFRKRFPNFLLPSGSEAVFEPDGGFLLVEDCVRCFCEGAKDLGAELRFNSAVSGWRVREGKVEVACGGEIVRAERLVVAAGAWSNELLCDLGFEIRILRKHLHWYRVPQGMFAGNLSSPVFFYDTPDGFYYGFPSLEFGDF